MNGATYEKEGRKRKMSFRNFSFEKYSKNNALMSVVMVVLGLALFIWPGKTLDVLAHILGIALLLSAAISGVSWYRDRHKAGMNYGPLAVALMCVVMGLVVLFAPRGIITLLPKLIGIAIIINGLINLAQALELRKASVGNWTSSLVVAALTVALGIFLVVFSFSAMKAAVMVIGGIFVYNGVSNLWIESSYRKMDK